MSQRFDSFVAVDWSGAAGRSYSGIAIAECGPGAAAPTLVAPPGKRWRRSDFVGWLSGRAADGKRMLVGIDCAFALPAEAGCAILGESYGAPDLWRHIDQVCDPAEDFLGAPFASHEDYRALFWHDGPRPAGFPEHHRETEIACAAAGLGTPQSPLKLIGPRQVGKGGLAGMRALDALKQRIAGDFAVWPFDSAESGRIVAVELYPRLFLRIAGHGPGKVRTLLDLDRCLAALGSAPYAGAGEAVTDHETDALVAASGLRKIADDPASWNPPGLNALARRAEGWIFGVP
jgi:hypothetical protein